LKAQKEEVLRLSSECDERGRTIAARKPFSHSFLVSFNLLLGYLKLQSQKTDLQDIPLRIKQLTSDIEALREEYPSPNKETPAQLTLPLPETRSLLEQQRVELARLEAEIAALQSQELPRIQQDLARVETELSTLNNQKKAAVSRAKEAKDRKENGGVDEVERRGRWVKSGDKLLRDVLDDDDNDS